METIRGSSIVYQLVKLTTNSPLKNMDTEQKLLKSGEKGDIE
jgi:hypothetical protein